MKRILVIAAVIACTCTQTYAQVLEEYIMYSGNSSGLGTARSAAMGGAFTSLGADLSSIAINPAGLGMYRTSEIGISPAITFGSTEVMPYTFPQDRALGYSNNEILNGKTNTTRPTLNNLGAALNVYQGTGAVTSVTLGLSVNRVADFNGKYSVNGRSATSMLDFFGSNMASSGLHPNPDNFITGYDLDGMGVNYWGGALAYNTLLLEYDPYVPGGEWYIPGDLFDTQNPNQLFASQDLVKTRGGIDQVDMGLGMNFGNTLYLGMSVGIQDIYYSADRSYRESPMDNDGYELRYFDNNRYLDINGTSWNFKFGATVMPVTGLRIGAAIHTPSYVSLEENYREEVYSSFVNLDSGGDYFERGAPLRYNFHSPAKLSTGISYTIGSTAILSFDWDRVWYNKIKTYTDGWNFEDLYFNNYVESVLKPANNFRAGVEAAVAEGVFLRGGYAEYGSAYKNDFGEDWGKTTNYSGGVGFRSGAWSLDVSYVHSQSKEAPAYVFNNLGSVPDMNAVWSAPYQTKRMRNIVTVSGTFRFSTGNDWL